MYQHCAIMQQTLITNKMPFELTANLSFIACKSPLCCWCSTAIGVISAATVSSEPCRQDDWSMRCWKCRELPCHQLLPLSGAGSSYREGALQEPKLLWFASSQRSPSSSLASPWRCLLAFHGSSSPSTARSYPSASGGSGAHQLCRPQSLASSSGSCLAVRCPVRALWFEPCSLCWCSVKHTLMRHRLILHLVVLKEETF